MKTLSFLFLGAWLLLAGSLCAAEKDTRVYELRVYYAMPDKFDALNARFRDHTINLFKKHGMTNIGYWMPIDNPNRMLVYVLAYPSREAREKSWKAFRDDPAWQKALKRSEKDGPLVKNVEAVLMTATDYSPAIKPMRGGGETPATRVFELRTYIASPGNLSNLNARFRDHTLKLFKKHGMTNVGYWTPMKDQKGATDTLIYLLAHKNVEAAQASFAAFRKDPAWNRARKESEDRAGGPLTVEDGVKSLFMKPTNYSPTK